jgi:hypothetical protein
VVRHQRVPSGQPFTYGVGRFLPDVRTDGWRTSISRRWELPVQERFRAQRAEFINAFNSPQFGYRKRLSLTFGRVSSQYNAPRQVQAGLKIYW